MAKRIGSLVTLLVLVLTECFTPMCCVLAENNTEPDFEVEETTGETTDTEEFKEITEEPTKIEETKEIIEETINTEEIGEIMEETTEIEKAEDFVEETIDTEKIEATEDIEPDDSEADKELNKTENESTDETISENEIIEDETEGKDIQNLNDESFKTDSMQNDDDKESNNDTPADFQSTGQTSSQVDTTIDAPQNDANKEKENIEEPEGTTDTITEEIREIISKIRYFFKIEGDNQYIKYGRDTNNIGTITLKDPKTGASITIMDKNLGAESVGIGRTSYGYYFQWGNNHGVKTINSSNKTTQKAVYKDIYYSHGYDGQGNFIVGGSDYWEDGNHYNNLWGNETKESSRYGACPPGYHIPTVKEWNQLLSIRGKIHTQDTTTNETVLRYSADYTTRNIHTFKGAATQCAQGETECVDENKLSIITETLSEELKLPLAGSYDENGNFHDELGVYWTSIAKDGNKAGVFDMNTYIGDGMDGALMYKSQGHNIRCFQNLEPYEAPVNPEIQNDESSNNDTSIDSSDDELTSKLQTGSGVDSQQNGVNFDESQNDEENTQDSYPESGIPSDIEPDLIIQDTTGDIENYEIDAKEYTITWKNEDGNIRDTSKVAYGQMPTHEDPVQPSDEKYSYKFVGWEPELEKVEGDAEYKAKYMYIPMEYTITWKNEDGTVIDTSKVAYGQMPTHANPIQPADEKYSYKFAGWEPKLSEVKGNVEYRAKYEYILNKYTITRENEDGTIIDTTEVVYGQIPTHEDPHQPADEKYSYEFAGWNSEITEVTGPAEYRATYKYITNKYIVTWKNENETVLGTGEVEYGAIPTYDGKLPTKESSEEFEYTFAGREPEIEEIKGDVVYKATYTESPIIQNEESNDGNEVQTGSLEKISQDNEQTIQELQSESQNNENIASGTQGDENEGGDNTNEDSSINTSKGENTIQEGENSEEEQGFFGGLWETLKSFFLDDEDGYLRGSEIINDIIVSVESEEGTFPTGTEVVIKGVSEDRLETIQTSLIEDESNNVGENAQIVAFDISFIYSGEEIQPEKEVSVKFNYKENSDFQGASEKELSVYHIDDETDEGTEIQVASKDGDEIEILATDFSIYVLTLSDNNSVTLTLNPGDGTIITGDNIIVNEQGIGTITSVDGNVTLPNATRENHVFVGRYTSQTSSLQSFAGNGGDEYHVNSNTTLYAIWCNDGYTINTEKTTCILEGDLKTILDQNPNFMWGEIEIRRPSGLTDNDGPVSITIMDRDLGALIAGTDSNAYGYYYQFGNNRGFSGGTINKITKDTALVNLSLYTAKVNPYYSGNFVYKNSSVQGSSAQDWAVVPNDNIWGGNGTEDLRQGPCPVGWHVPTTGEWQNVVNYWTVSGGMTKGVLDSSNITSFMNNLKLTLAGERARSNANVTNIGTVGNYRTTQVSPVVNKNSGGRSYLFRITTAGGSVVGDSNYNRVNGQSVRCFKNEDTIVREYTVTYNDGVDDREIFEDQIFSGLLEGDDFPQFIGSIPGRTGDDGVYHEFVGWFLEGTEIAFDVSGAKVNGNTSLYAIWKGCPIGEEENALGFCVPTAEEQRNRQIVQDLELYFLASDQNKVHYTIMDRNMGATAVFDKYYDGPNSESLGYLYQWGNNYGFPVDGDLVSQGVFIRTTQVPKNIWSAGVPSNYASGTYYLNSTDHVSWMENPTTTDGIWGGTGDTMSANGVGTTLEARQGPCPAGYHVPSTLEWKNIFNDWSGVKVGLPNLKQTVYSFSEDLLLPPAGRRGKDGAQNTTYKNATSYWSSSPGTGAVMAFGFYLRPNDDNPVQTQNVEGRARARSVRCVKNVVNTSATSISTDDIHLDGGGNAVISIDNGVISSLRSPTRIDSTFEGWYTSSDFSGNVLSVGNSIQAGSSLYAKFTCNETGYIWNGSGCEGGIRLYFDSMGGTEVPSQLIESGMTGTRPADPTKTGYVFSGWFLTGAIEEFDFTGTPITGETTVYAHWNTGEYEVSIVSNNVDYGTVDSGSIIADYGTPISTNENELTIGSTTVIATPAASGEQYTYTFSGWTFENCGIEGAESVTTNCEITANFDRISNGYTVTWNNSDGTTLETDLNVPYGTMPSYDGGTPTSGGDAQYSYTFEGWSPATGVVQGDITYTATYAQNVNAYTVMIQSSNINSGTVTTGFITVPYGTNISKSGNILEIGNETSTANPNSQTWQYDFAFVDWADTCGTTVTTGCTITANFQSILRTYTLDLVIGTGIENIYYKVNGASEFINTGITTTISGVEAGSTIYAYAEAKDGYTYSETSESNPWSVTVTGNNVFSPIAVKDTDTQYIVYHYVKRVGLNIYELAETETGYGITDSILILSGLAKESEFLCAHYDGGSLTGTENGPGEIVTQTTIRGDGSTKIYLYYARTYHRIVLSGDAHIESLEIDGNESTEAVRECGGEVPINAKPKPGYHFVRWDKEEKEEKKENENSNEGLP